MSEEMMEEQPEVFQVYARPNEKGEVIKIFSTCFFQPQEGDVLLKEGSGDEFAHVGYYKVYDENGFLNYVIKDGALADRDKTADLARLEARALSAQYIPSEVQSVAAFARFYLAENPPASNEERLAVSGLYSEWEAGSYAVGDIRNHAGQTWVCRAAHDNAVYPDITPENPQTWANFWKPLHGTSAETARPWTKPWAGTTDMYRAGTTDMYRAGEYMVYTDGKTYKCLADTVYSPEEYAQAWEATA